MFSVVEAGLAVIGLGCCAVTAALVLIVGRAVRRNHRQRLKDTHGGD